MPNLSHISIITPVYPDKRFIERGAFVERLVTEWCNSGVKVDVIAPRSYANQIRSLKENHTFSTSIAGTSIHYPNYFSISEKKVGSIHLGKYTRKWFLKAAMRAIEKMPLPDIFYGKFLMRGGLAVIEAAKKTGRPAFVDLGEHLLLDLMDQNELQLARHICKSLDGITTVSDQLARDVIELGADPEKVFVYPNTVNLNQFRPLQQSFCRKELNLPLDCSIVIFTGHFIHRKGPIRVLNALKMIHDQKVYGIFLGRGGQNPVGNEVLFSGPVPNDKLPLYLGAADLFVLPTLNEGYCNAINEAMACKLPIISSDIEEIRNQVPEEAGIFIDPLNEEQIARSISELINDSVRKEKMGCEALNAVTKRSKISRADAILDWLESTSTESSDRSI